MKFKSISKKLITVLVVLSLVLQFGITAAFAAGDISVSVTASATEITLGQSVDLTIEVEGATIETSTQIKVGNTVLETIKGDEYKYTYTPTTSGSVTITAISGRLNGSLMLSPVSDSVDILVGSNDAPVVSIDGYSGGAIETQLGAEESLVATATDNNDVEKMEIYIDGVVVASQEGDNIELPYSSVGLGEYKVEVVATDSYGLTGTSGEITVKVSNEIEHSKSVAPYPTGASFRDGRTYSKSGWAGFAELRNLEGYDEILAIGRDESCDPEMVTTSGSFVELSVAKWIDLGGTFSLDFDFNYAKAFSQQNVLLVVQAYVVLAGGGSNQPNMIKIETLNDGKHYITSYVGNKTKYEIQEDEWYHVKMSYDWKAGKLDVFVTDKNGVTTQIEDDAILNLNLKQGDKLSLYRFGLSKQANTEDFYAEAWFDNFEGSVLRSSPAISEFKAEGETISATDDVPYTAQEFTAILTTAPIKKTINQDTVYLLDKNNNKVLFNSVDWDSETKTITAQLASALTPGENYSFVLDKTMQMEENIPFGADVKKSFTLSPAGCYSVEEKWYTLGEDVTCITEIVNGNTEATTVYQIRSSWSGDEFLGTYIEEITLEPGANEVVGNFAGAKSGTADMYIISDIENPYVYCNIGR